MNTEDEARAAADRLGYLYPARKHFIKGFLVAAASRVSTPPSENWLAAHDAALLLEQADLIARIRAANASVAPVGVTQTAMATHADGELGAIEHVIRERANRRLSAVPTSGERRVQQERWEDQLRREAPTLTQYEGEAT